MPLHMSTGSEPVSISAVDSNLKHLDILLPSSCEKDVSFVHTPNNRRHLAALKEYFSAMPTLRRTWLMGTEACCARSPQPQPKDLPA